MFDNKGQAMPTQYTSATVTATAGPECQHKNGWYHHIPFGPFSRRVFACMDCGHVLYGKKLDLWEGCRK